MLSWRGAADSTATGRRRLSAQASAWGNCRPSSPTLLPADWPDLVKATTAALLPLLLREQFPAETRAIVSLSFSTAVSVFGELVLFVATWLIAQTGGSLSRSDHLTGSAAVWPPFLNFDPETSNALVKTRPVERVIARAPVVKHPLEAALGEMRRRHVLWHVGQAEPGECRIGGAGSGPAGRTIK